MIEQLEKWIQQTEGETLEFKAARTRFGLDELTGYAVALANEGGGKIILGVRDKRPRKVVGSTAFPQPEQTRGQLNQRLHLGITFDIIDHPDGRVLVFHVPSRPVGIPVQFKGKFLVREDESLVGMSGERLREIYDESGRDFSADVCPDLTIDDLSDQAIEVFRGLWAKWTKNQQINSLSKQQLLLDIDVANDQGITYAGLVLFGCRDAVRKHLAQAEFVFEYRPNNAAGPAGQREEFTEGFFLYYDRLWELVNLRNDNQHYQDGPFVLNIPTFNERAIREAILNAVSHRNYQLGGNVFLRQFPERIEVDSPGGLSPQVTLETILYRQSPRNRRIAEVFNKCGLVERSGQGVDLMYSTAIRSSQARPDFSRSDDHNVSLVLAGRVKNKNFVRFIAQYDAVELDRLSTQHWLILDLLGREERLPKSLLPDVDHLLDLGMVVRAGRDRHILSRDFYEYEKRLDTFERLRENESRKETLEAYLLERAVDGSPVRDLLPLVSDLSRDQVRGLLAELKAEFRIHSRGEKRGARWYPGPSTDEP